MNSDSEPDTEPLVVEVVNILANSKATPTVVSSSSSDGDNNSNSRKYTFVEPALLLVFFAMNLSAAVFQNQLLYQSCVSVFNYTEDACAPLMGMLNETAESQSIETEVQPYVAKILMTRTLLDSLIPAVLSLFIGPWSDKFGRRPVILAAFTGYFLGYLTIICVTILTTQYNIQPWWYVLASLPVISTGGICSLITVSLCYVSDVATAQSKALRMVLMEVAIFLGLMIGSFTSSYIYEATNAVTVFSISASALFIALVYITFFVGESLEPQNISNESKIKGFFRYELAVDLFQTCFERRPNYDRVIIWLVMLSLGFSIFVLDGDGTVMYLFTREKFQWTLKQYNLYQTLAIICEITFNFVGIYILRKLFKVSVTSIALLAFGSSVLKSLVVATATFPWQMYLAIAMGLFKGIASPMCRAILACVTPGSDLGKIFALTTSLETLMPLLSAPLYQAVYSATITTYPGAFSFISSGTFFLCYVFLAIVFFIQKSNPTSMYHAI